MALTPPGLLSSKVVDVKKQNERNIQVLVEATKNTLTIASKSLGADYKALKHVPVRTHFRILAAAMFLMKVRTAISLPFYRSR